MTHRSRNSGSRGANEEKCSLSGERQRNRERERKRYICTVCIERERERDAVIYDSAVGL